MSISRKIDHSVVDLNVTSLVGGGLECIAVFYIAEGKAGICLGIGSVCVGDVVCPVERLSLYVDVVAANLKVDDSALVVIGVSALNGVVGPLCIGQIIS